MVISRNEDIMADLAYDNLGEMFSVTLAEDNDLITYTLTIRVINRIQFHARYECVADIVGYPLGLWPRTGTVLIPEGNVDVSVCIRLIRKPV